MNIKLTLWALAICLPVFQPAWSSGVKMTAAAKAFLESLTDVQRKQAVLPLESSAMTDWHFVPKRSRKGIQMRDMNEGQQELAIELLATCVSKSGFTKARGIMSLESTLHEYDGNRQVRDPLRYYFTFFGTPSVNGIWALSFEGHHISLNYVINDGRLTCGTPAFFATNPARVIDNRGSGPPVGSRFLKEEEDLAFKLVLSLNTEQQSKAILSAKSPRDMREGGKAQTEMNEPTGLSASGLTDGQKSVLQALVSTYFNNLPSELVETWLQRTLKDLAAIHFSWSGQTGPGEPYSYTIQGKDFIVILFNTQNSPDGTRSNHVHSVLRTLGHDFGK